MALLEERKKKLSAEGLFDEARKQLLPFLPRIVGVVTSPTGAVIRDILHRLSERFPRHVLVWPVRVQGEGAAIEIAAAIVGFNALPESGRVPRPDVLIVARGGGSLEDLWAFNEEEVVRAIANSEIPVISGIGHETDFTIADFVADVRASTPSAAAELVVQTRREFDKHIADLRNALNEQMRYRILVLVRRVHELAGRRGFRRPLDLLRQQRQRADELTSRLAHGLRANVHQSRRRFTTAHMRIVSFDFRMKIAALRLRLEKRSSDLGARADRLLRVKRERLDRLRLQLEERSPLRVLERGYAIATNAAGQVLRDATQVSVGDTVNVHLHRGKLITEVKDKES
jgi:exodeoxyribonuclease VII large subunit